MAAFITSPGFGGAAALGAAVVAYRGIGKRLDGDREIAADALAARRPRTWREAATMPMDDRMPGAKQRDAARYDEAVNRARSTRRKIRDQIRNRTLPKGV